VEIERGTEIDTTPEDQEDREPTHEQAPEATRRSRLCAVLVGNSHLARRGTHEGANEPIEHVEGKRARC
jgi:hypothetical protein